MSRKRFQKLDLVFNEIFFYDFISQFISFKSKIRRPQTNTEKVVTCSCIIRYIYRYDVIV